MGVLVNGRCQTRMGVQRLLFVDPKQGKRDVIFGRHTCTRRSKIYLAKSVAVM